MRVTRIPDDHNDIGDKPCRVYLNGAEILDWTVADDFRRVVETPAGARFGAVRIEMIQGVSIPDDASIEIDGQVVEREVQAEVAPASVKPNTHIPARKRKASR